MSCGKPVDYTIPKGWDYKTLKYKCGNTGIDGRAVLCGECAQKVSERKMAEPGYCIHGVFLGDGDCACYRCEFE